MKRSLLLLGLIAALALSGCATRAFLPTEAPAATQAPAMAPSYDASRQTAGGGAAPGGPLGDVNKAAGEVRPPVPAAAAQQPGGDRIVIQNAELSIVVSDVNARVTAIQDMAKAMGGFIVTVNVYQATYLDGEPVPQAAITVRVPSDRLEDALKQIKAGVVDVQNETRSGQDVTDQYVDLQSRLKAKQAAEAQLLTIMQDAKRTEDVLAVYSQLQQIESDIEVLKGQIKFYEQSAAMSAISVTVIAEQTVKPIQVAGWKPEGVARDAIQRLIYFWQDFVNFLINAVLYVLPVLITIAIPLYLFFLLLRWVLRKTRRPRPVAPVETPK